MTTSKYIRTSSVYTPIHYNINSEGDEKIGEHVCLFKYTGAFHNYIYYEIDNNKFLIRTAWIINYHNKIKETLENTENVKIFYFDSDKQEKDNKCNWIAKAHFSEWLVDKGSIFKFTNNPNITYEHGVSVGLKALEENYPLLEILIIIIFTLILPITLIIIYFYIFHTHLFKSNNSNRLSRTQNSNTYNENRD
jgi:hypothetical protein